jgi:hypothetical protein
MKVVITMTSPPRCGHAWTAVTAAVTPLWSWADACLGRIKAGNGEDVVRRPDERL